MDIDANVVLAYVEAGLKQPEFKTRLLMMLSRRGHVYLPYSFIRAHKIETAKSLMQSGMARSEARAALESRLGVHRCTAYRLINAALGE